MAATSPLCCEPLTGTLLEKGGGDFVHPVVSTQLQGKATARNTYTNWLRDTIFTLARPTSWMRTCPSQSSGSQRLLGGRGVRGGGSCSFSKFQPTWVTVDGVGLRERTRQHRSSALCLAGPTGRYVWREVRTLCEMHLAVFGKRLLFGVFPSLQLPVIRFSSLLMARPQTKLVATQSCFDEKEIRMLILTVPTAEEHLPSNLWNYSH